MRALVIVAIGCATRSSPPGDGGARPSPPAAPRPAPAARPAPPGEDLIDDVRLVLRVAACGGDAAVPPAWAEVVDKHCKAILPYVEKYRRDYFGKARAWFVAKEPNDLPTTVVYPFGGGDLISALVAFPDATDITTISLELAGDPRHMAELAPDELDRNLEAFRKELGLLVANGSNSSINLSNAQRNLVPAQLASHLLGLVAGGFEPVAVRYFTLDDDGAIHYLERAEIDADTARGKSLRGNWKTPAFAQSFANVEIQYRKPGETALRVHRHIAWNLADAYLRAHPGVLRYLEAKGRVTVLVKGASYLLWLGDFSLIRGYLLDHLAWMLSDSTGIPPTYARGMTQETYGAFHGPIVDKVAGRPEDDAMRELWKKNRSRAMPFRFGYLDLDGDAHVMITRPTR